jgi:dipeptidyl aminopeptidase/acylaminoacyl peptidase
VYVPIGLVAAYLVGFPIVTAVYSTHPPRPSLGSSTPADRGLEYHDVEFPASDGVRLSGWYIPARNRAAVVVLHGSGSTRTAVLGQAAVLARHGYGVLLFDARGMGRSGGRAMNRGWYGDRDVIGALDFLEGQPGVDSARLGALGESMGGEEAIGAMAADERLRAVVAEGATNRVASDLSWLSDDYGVRGYVQEGLNHVADALTNVLTPASPPRTLRAAVRVAAPRPVLLITAGRVADERLAARHIAAASPSSVSTWDVRDASHTGGLRTATTEWERRVAGFFDDALRAR